MEVMSGFYWDSGKKEINQDSVLVEQVNTGKGRILLAAVSDGIGGLPAGEVASGFLMERLQQHFYEEILPLIRKGKALRKSDIVFSGVFMKPWGCCRNTLTAGRYPLGQRFLCFCL